MQISDGQGQVFIGEIKDLWEENALCFELLLPAGL